MTRLLQQARGRLRRADPDSGASTVEMVILVSVLVAIMVLIVGLGRWSYSKERVQQAATAASRAASLGTSTDDASQRADNAAEAALSSAGLACTDMDVQTSSGGFVAGGQVTVTVTCTVNLSDSVMAGLPGSSLVTATSTVPLENYRQFGGGG